jgi:hypothetical protein
VYRCQKWLSEGWSETVVFDRARNLARKLPEAGKIRQVQTMKSHKTILLLVALEKTLKSLEAMEKTM